MYRVPRKRRLASFCGHGSPPTAGGGLKAANSVGESYGKFKHRWVLAPDDFVGAPGREPPPTPLDPSRSQRFIMTDGVCTFGDGKDGFRGFGAGVTFQWLLTGGRSCSPPPLAPSSKVSGHSRTTRKVRMSTAVRSRVSRASLATCCFAWWTLGYAPHHWKPACFKEAVFSRT